MSIPRFPEFAPISFEMQPSLHPDLALQPDGISEFTFANLYLFRHTYGYQLSSLTDEHLAISGTKEGKRFFMLPCGLPDDKGIVRELFEEHHYLKGLAERFADASRVTLERMGFNVQEDRDNFDYLYLRSALEELPGRKYHKKRNLIRAFVNNYDYSEYPIRKPDAPKALSILERWTEQRDDAGDYKAAREALEYMRALKLSGYLVEVEGEPAAYTLGEPVAKGRAFAVHFEKAVGDYKGIYQFINRAFAAVLPKHYVYINREQDLGDPGMRQAKMTYRPSGFVKKYIVTKTETQS